MPKHSNSDIRIYFSDIFGVHPDTLDKHGAFNISLVNDLPLFIDPFLLFNSARPEYRSLHDQIIEFLRFLRDVSADGDLKPGLISRWFTFPEVRQNWLGYSTVGNRGSGLGAKFAKALHLNLHTVFTEFGHEQITRSSHLEKLCLIRDKVGRDNISDLTTNLIKGFLLKYTSDFAVANIRPALRRRHTIDRVQFNYDTRTWTQATFDLPHIDGDYVILTPKDILTKDDTWINQRDLLEDFTEITESIPNSQLRAQINEYLARKLPGSPSAAERRKAISGAIEKFPAIIDYFIRYKEDHGKDAVRRSSSRVKAVEASLVHAVRDFAQTLGSVTQFYATDQDTYDEAKRRVQYLKTVIEQNGGHRFFYVKGQPIKRELDLQLMFRLVWFGTTADVSSEVNDGRGPVDFKISRGLDKVLVEFKLAGNSKLEQNLANQTNAYQKASGAKRALKVILFFSQAEHEKLKTVLKRLKLNASEDVILIDARSDNKPSGSKVRTNH